MRISTLVFALLLLATGCKKSDAWKTYFDDGLLYSKSVYLLNDVVMENNFPPIIASRNYTYANIAAYETMTLGTSKWQSLAGQLNGLTPMTNLDTNGVCFPFAALLSFVKVGNAVTFPEGSMMQYYNELIATADSLGMPNEVQQASIRLSDSVVSHLLQWAKKDNYLQSRTAPKYTVLATAGRWTPTPPAYHQALEPHWNTIRTLALDSAGQFRVPPPIPFDMTNKSSAYYQQVLAVKNAGDTLTAEQKHIALFWDDLATRMIVKGHVRMMSKKFSPPGHWMGIIGIAAKNAKADFNTTVEAYALTSIAMFDAFIHCWDEKFRYNTVRPETVINRYIDPNWRPLLETPPFPEYTCGHSTVSSAAAETLTHIFGDNQPYTDTTEVEFGIEARSFQSFRHAALENNLARFYGGIHFHPSCVVSTDFGAKVGQFVTTHIKTRK